MGTSPKKKAKLLEGSRSLSVGKDVPLSALSNFQIQDYYEGCPEFGGCPSNDEIAAIHDPKKFYIINMADRDSGGSHWTLLFQNLYFDSFGVQPTLTVLPLASVWNTEDYQNFHSSACGFYCIYVADNLLAGRSPTEGLLDKGDETMTGPKSNETILRKYFDNKVGAGFFSNFVDRFKPRKAESKRLRKFLDTEGEQKVTKIQIARKPVHSSIQKALDFVSRGKFSQVKKKLNYDDVFHQYLLVTLQDGRTYKVEKNHIVESTLAQPADYVKESSNVPITKEITLSNMINNASNNDPNFWRYRAAKENCQDFTKNTLERNGLKPENQPEIQNAKELIDSLPLGETVPNALTDVAAYADSVIHGGSLNIGQWY
jgi:hypothetical protein